MIHHETLARQLELIRTKQATPAEVVREHLENIHRLNPKLNAFTHVFEKAADFAPAQGPLHGAPLTIKDSFDIEGLPTFCGNRERIADVASADAACVRRLEAAGAILLGKTNTPENLYNYETDNFITGRTNNPWNLERTPGGSSGGESAAIASFCSAGGVGSDGGGSIRIPAHFTGIAGLKPTPGRVSAAGHVPQIAHPGGLLGVAGPMARTVEDVAILYRVLAGYDADDPFSAPVPLSEANLDGLRIGMMTQWLSAPVDPEIRTAVEQAGRVIESELKIPVEPFVPVGMEQAAPLWFFFFVEIYAEFLRAHSEHWTGRELIEMTNRHVDGWTIVEKLSERDAMRSSLLRQMEHVPALLLPVCGTVAFRHHHRPMPLLEAVAPVVPFNLFGMPALVLPWTVGTEGLPIGIQMVARPWEEALLLEIGQRLETARGPFTLPREVGL